MKALRLVSQALDAEHQTTTHSRALAAGWTAIREADDMLQAYARYRTLGGKLTLEQFADALTKFGAYLRRGCP